MASRSREVVVDGLDRWHRLFFSSHPPARLAHVLTTRPPRVGDELEVAIAGVTVLQGPVRSVRRVRQVWAVRCEPEGSERLRGRSPDRLEAQSWRDASLGSIAGDVWGDAAELVGDAAEVMVPRFGVPAGATHEWAVEAVLEELRARGFPVRVALDADGRWRIGRPDDLVRRGAWEAQAHRRNDWLWTYTAIPVATGDEITSPVADDGPVTAATVTTEVAEHVYRTRVLVA